ncbi:sporulation histidine kinase inhibitor Sda [Bacillus sp. FJAT-44742]|nr:sporulation histidine kinase inhibitor Sda [Bacillus sp. FJAT-44742]
MSLEELSDKKLLEAYRLAQEENLEEQFVELLRKEIRKRNLSVPGSLAGN